MYPRNKSGIAMVKAEFNKKKAVFTSQLYCKFKEETSKVLHLLGRVDWKYLENFEMWFCRRMEKISWSDRVEMKKCYTELRRRGISYIQ
jgi:hypothetical protein